MTEGGIFAFLYRAVLTSPCDMRPLSQSRGELDMFRVSKIKTLCLQEDYDDDSTQNIIPACESGVSWKSGVHKM